MIVKMKKQSAMIDANNTKRSSRDRQLTITLMLVTFALLLLTGPQYIRYLVYLIVDPSKDPWMFAVYILFVHVSNKLSFLNSSVNFFLYCFGGSKFRKEAYRIMSCGKYRSSNLTDTNGGTY